MTPDTHVGMGRWPARPMLGTGQIRHARLRPTEHRFAYGACFLWLPVRALVARPQLLADVGLHGPWLSFKAADHGAGAADLSSLVAWVDSMLRTHGIDDADGELWLQCFPRTLGHAFKPVSIWHALRADGSLRATVAEVNNTFGERHCYVLDLPRWGHTHWANKAFHVSPFFTVQGRYAFRFMSTQDDGTERGETHRSVVRIDHTDDQGTLLQTSISGNAVSATPALLRQAFWRHPVQSWAVVARIHWQALRLWIKGVAFHTKPTPPVYPVTVAALATSTPLVQTPSAIRQP